MRMETKVILVQPPFPANERHKRVMPLGLAYLAAYLRREPPGVAVEILDAHIENLSLEATLARVGERCAGEGLTIVGISYWTLQAPFAYALSEGIKKRWPGTVVVHGGVHCSVMPEEALRYADYCVLREGEVSFAQLVAALAGGREIHAIPGTACRSDEGHTVNPPRDFIDDLDLLPFPAWELLSMESYDYPLHIVGGARVPVIGSRGCPYNCSYCVSPVMWGRKLRWRSPENVLEEMEEIIRRYGIPRFHFWDDNLMLNRDYIRGLCEGILKRGMSVRWTGLTRASHVVENADLMPLLSRAGCIGLEIGIESANPETFRRIGKEESLDQIMEVADLHKRHGMHPMFTYMAFNPGETIYGYWLQANLIDAMLEGMPAARHFQPTPFPLYLGQFCTPHPGTALRRQAETMGIMLADGWHDCYHHQVNFVPHSLLDDSPVRIKKRLEEKHYALLDYFAHEALWSYFNESVPMEEQRKTLRLFRRFAERFYRYSRGKETVGRIAEKVRIHLGVDEKTGIRFAAFCAYMLAQMGMIRSAHEEASAEIQERHIADLSQIPKRL